jgi:hypothetical protein
VRRDPGFEALCLSVNPCAATVSGVISYTHVYDLTVSRHQPVMVARLMPFGVDGLIVVGSVVLLQATQASSVHLGWTPR